MRLENCLLDVGPNVGSVVSIQINKLFEHLVLELNVLGEWQAVLLRKIFLAIGFDNLVQISLVSVLSDDVDSSVKIGTYILLTVLLCLHRQNVVVRNLLEVQFYSGLFQLAFLRRVQPRINNHLRRITIFDHWPLLFQKTEGVLRICIEIAAHIIVCNSFHFLAEIDSLLTK